MDRLKVVQVALTTTDLPATLRFYSEVFGFANAGGIPIWGDPMALQGLPSTARAMMWWLVDGQPFFQLEIFAHSEPFPQAKPSDWQASDHGWVRLGIAAPSVEVVRGRLASWSAQLLGETTDVDGVRRIAFVDPTTSALVEVFEDPAADRAQVRYATFSTDDLAESRRLYEGQLGFEILPLETLHTVAHEALWGLPDAQRDGFVASAGGVQVEVVEYATPKGRPKSAGSSITDLGIMNVAIGARGEALVRQAIDRARAAGHATTPEFGDGGSVVTYLTGARTEIELISVPVEAERFWGFQPIESFLGSGS